MYVMEVSLIVQFSTKVHQLLFQAALMEFARIRMDDNSDEIIEFNTCVEERKEVKQ